MKIHPDQPLAGLLAPLFALRGTADLGVGDVGALRSFVDWAANSKFRLVQLLPINETGGDNSPYNAISSTAIDPLTIDVSPKAIPDLTARDFDSVLKRFDLDKLREGPVKYAKVKRLKRTLLEKAFARFEALKFGSPRVGSFLEFMAEQSTWIESYALFRVLMDEHGSEKWDRWPEAVRTASATQKWLASLPAKRRAAFCRQARFHQYVQWIAFEQWKSLKTHCDRRGIALMGDVPFGVSYYSADVFANPALFDLDWSGGAPPERFFRSDPFTEKWGQNWGIPLYRWDVMRADGFAWWRVRVRTVRSVFHLFRIDHILGCYRIYAFPWRPERNDEFLPLDEAAASRKTGGRLPVFKSRDDATHENREANRRQGEELLKVLLDEVGKFRLVGEDLGIVPPYVRPSLTSLGIAGFKVPQWELEQGGRLIAGEHYPRLSLATYATHDHPTIKAAWDGWFAALSGQGDSVNQGPALDEMRALAGYAGMGAPLPRPFDDQVLDRLLEALFNSNAWLAVVMITDLFGSTQRFNVPGAVADSNWSERLPNGPRAWSRDARLQARLKRINAVLSRSGRLP